MKGYSNISSIRHIRPFGLLRPTTLGCHVNRAGEGAGDRGEADRGTADGTCGRGGVDFDAHELLAAWEVREKKLSRP